MARHRQILLTLLCLLVFLPGAGAAPLWEEQLSFRRFTTLEGLPQMQTETVWQDAEGYIYIGTLSGFVRYDGRALTPFLGGRRENIVQFTQVGGEVRALGFVRQWSVKGNQLRQSQIDPSGERLLNNLNAAALPPGYILLENRQEQGRVLFRLTDGGMQPVLDTPLLDDMTPDRKLYMDPSGIYLPTPQGLFAAVDGAVRKLSAKADVFSLIRSGEELFALAADGIYRLDPEGLTIVLRHSFDGYDCGLSVQKNRQGELFIADTHSIWRYDGGSLQQLATGFNLIRGLFVDRWNRLWAATYQGAYCFFHCNFTHRRLTDHNDIVRALAACDGHLVMGTLNGKVLMDSLLVDDKGSAFYEPGAAVVDHGVYMAGNGDVWGFRDGALQRLGLPEDRYRFVAAAGERLILGAARSVLSWYPATGRLDTLTTEIVRPWCAAPGAEGRLWVSGNPGLYCLKEGGVRKVLSTPTTPVVTAMTADGKGLVCFSLGDELYAIRGEEPCRMEEVAALLRGHEIRSLHLSPRGYLVVAAMDGLLVARLDAEGRSVDSRWFDAMSGFTIIEPQLGSMAEEADGTVWLAGLEDMLSFKPEALLADNQQLALVLPPRPWWRKGWVLLPALLLLCLLLWQLSRWSAQRQTRKRTALLEREKTQKELQLQAVRLKAIPHFHANVLSSIEYFVMNRSADEASHYLKIFSDFTNQTLSDIDRPARSVASEVDYVRSYLELERLRYGDRLQYRIDLAPDVDRNVLLPTMLLHTYCQNAVKHGIASKDGAGNIEVRIRRQEREGAEGVLLSVQDDGIGRQEAARSGGYSTGQGLKILGQQIDLYNQANAHKIVQQVKDLTDESGRPAGTCFETWVPVDYKY